MHSEYISLIRQSLKARKLSYSPYSGFKVGAALLGASGKVYCGANIESASYSLTLCAERVVFSKAISEGEKKFRAIAISVSSNDLVFPCGACRQFIFEFAKDIDVIIASSVTEFKIVTLKELLPFGFERKSIPKKT